MSLQNFKFRCVSDQDNIEEKLAFCFRNFGNFYGGNIMVLNYMVRNKIDRARDETSHDWTMKIIPTGSKFFFKDKNDVTRFHLAWGTRSWEKVEQEEPVE